MRSGKKYWSHTNKKKKNVQNKTETMCKERLHQILWSNLQQDLSFGFHNKQTLKLCSSLFIRASSLFRLYQMHKHIQYIIHRKNKRMKHYTYTQITICVNPWVLNIPYKKEKKSKESFSCFSPFPRQNYQWFSPIRGMLML